MKTKPFLTYKYEYSRSRIDKDIFDVEFYNYNKTIVCKIFKDANEEYYEVKFIGVAKVHPEDTFDLVIGMQISFSKAIDKFNKYYESILDTFANEIIHEQNYISEGIGTKLWKIFDKNERRFLDENK